jgi:hypothetical protein
MGFVKITNKIYGKPLVILSECFFGTSEGMFLPLFALYENGQIIYRKNTKNEKVDYFEVILNNDEKNKFLNSLPFKNIYNIMEKIIDASDGRTDQPMSILELNINGYKKVRVDGNKRKFIPKEYILIYDELIKYKNEKAHKWYPESICVMFNDPFSDKNPKKWPENFPKINLNIKKDDRNNLPLVLEKKYLKEYFEFYNSLTRFQNIEFENNLYSIRHEMEYPNIEYDESIECEDDD